MTPIEPDIQHLTQELYDIFQLAFDEIFVTDAQGYVIRVNSACQKHYDIDTNELIGKHVRDLEEIGIFYPSATLDVIETKQSVELVQKTSSGRYLHVRARPVFHDNNTLKSVISYSRDLTELMELKQKLEDTEEQLDQYRQELFDSHMELEGLVTKSKKMKDTFKLVQRVAKVDSTVLVLGETGVGKSKIVRIIQMLSERKDNPFHEINCAALPEHLIEAELFGYEGGSFTGAFKAGKKGLLELSHTGTLFLDEVGELSLSAQSKLLHFLQEKKIRPIGGSGAKAIDVRIIAATNQNLEEMVERGGFRRDLYYRLNVVPIHILPLRERREDILPLVEHFLDYFNQRYRQAIKLSPKVLEAFLRYEWKGNVREVENIIERLVVTCDDTITVNDLPFQVNLPGERTLQEILEKVECSVIQDSYEKHRSSYKVAEELGISQSSAIRKIQKYVKE